MADLHDQTLAALTRLLRTVDAEDLPLDRAALNDGLSACIRDLRRIIDEAVPSQLVLFGFAHAIAEHLIKAVGADPCALTLVDRTGGIIDRIDPTVRTALFRITQEAANNAARHAKADRITITMDATPAGALCIVVRDDGIGMSGRVGTRRSGLLHMETRARLILRTVGHRGGCGDLRDDHAGQCFDRDSHMKLLIVERSPRHQPGASHPCSCAQVGSCCVAWRGAGPGRPSRPGHRPRFHPSA